MRRRMVRFATTVLACGGLGLAALGLAGAAQATPEMHTWCPGDPMPKQNSGPPLRWDMNVCHDWHYVGGDAASNLFPVEGAVPQLGPGL